MCSVHARFHHEIYLSDARRAAPEKLKTVIRFWGNDIKKSTDECIRVIVEAVFDIKIGDNRDAE